MLKVIAAFNTDIDMRFSFIAALVALFRTGLAVEDQTFKGCLIVSHGLGSQEPIPANLAQHADLFTTAAADTPASLHGLLTGLTTLTAEQNWVLPATNLFSMMPENVATGFFGTWPFQNTINLNNFVNTNDTISAINAAVNFVNAQRNFFCVIAVPRYALEYKVSRLANTGLCKYDTRTPKLPKVYKTCPDNIYQTSRIFENAQINRVTLALKNKQAFAFWMSDHGGVSELDDSYSVVPSKWRGMQHSLYLGGIGSRLYWSQGMLPAVQQRNFDARDFITSFAAVLKLAPQGAGLNIFDRMAKRNTPLEWMTPRAPNDECFYASPMFAVKFESVNSCLFVYYDAKRTETYFCNNIAQFSQNLVVPLPQLPRQVNAEQFVDGCKDNANVHSIKRKALANNQPTSLTPKIKPHVFILLLDDAGNVGFDSTSKPGQVTPDTPNIDALAERAVKFSNGFSNAKDCSPSRTSIMSGKYPFHSDIGIHSALEQGIKGHSSTGGNAAYLGAANPNISILPAILRKYLGYSTYHGGKWHLGGVSTGISPCSSIYGLDAGKFYVAKKSANCRYYNELVPYFSETIENDIVADVKAEISAKLAAGKPFFANLWFKEPHAPTEIHESILESIGKSSNKNPRKHLDRNVTLTDKRVPRQVYYAGLKLVDNAIGDFIRFLKEQNIFEKSIIYVLTDNPPETNGVDRIAGYDKSGLPRRGKRSTYDLRGPFLMFIGDEVYGARINGTTNLLTSFADILPTVFTAAGGNMFNLSDADRMDGINLMPYILQDMPQPNRCVIVENRHESIKAPCYLVGPRVVVSCKYSDGLYSLVLDSTEKSAPAQWANIRRQEFYNMSADPIQAQNLINDPRLQQRIAEIKQVLFNYKNYDTKRWPTTIPAHLGAAQTPGMVYRRACSI